MAPAEQTQIGQLSFEEDPSGETQLLTRMVLVSVIGHTLLAGGLVLKTYLSPSQPLQLENAIRVDLVGLPDKPSPAPPRPAPPTEPKAPVEKVPEPVAQPPPAPVPLPVQTAQPARPEQSAAIRRLEALQRLRQQKADDRRQEIAGMIKGNQVSRGSNTSGLIKQEQAAYLDELNAHIRANWSLPRWLQNSTYRARVVIFVDSKGQLLKKVFRQRSGNSSFDERVEAAIQQSIPLPVPPDSIAGLLATDGLELGFPE